MNSLSNSLLNLALLLYVAGAVAGLLCLRFEKGANLFSFGCASLAGLCGTIACISALAGGAAAANPSVALFSSLIPYIEFTVRLDPLPPKVKPALETSPGFEEVALTVRLPAAVSRSPTVKLSTPVLVSSLIT